MPPTTREWRLRNRPSGEPRPEDFELAEVALPEPGPGEVLIRNAFCSVDPYMRGRMRDAESYAAPYEVGAAMAGGAVGEVVASNDGPFAEGEWVQHMGGWREHALSDGTAAYRVDPALAPVSTTLGVLGMTGLTAYVGLTLFGRPQEGETVFVSAAAGAVGSVVGQLARLRGARAVGSAGSPEKVEWLTGELGFHAAFDYKRADSLRAALREHAPDGVDVYFDNVGGDHLEAALACMNSFGRVPLCGAISTYNAEEPPPGPRNFIALLTKRISVRGFIVTDHYDQMRPFLEEVGHHVRAGELRHRETIVDGIERMPQAFIGLLGGENIGKMLVRVGPDPG